MPKRTTTGVPAPHRGADDHGIAPNDAAINPRTERPIMLTARLSCSPMSTLPAPSLRNRVYEVLTGDDVDRVCLDIPEESCREQPRNFVLHVCALAASKTADGLLDPKVVLAWLVGAIGAPTFMLGLLVPIREAGALLPQLVIAAAIRSMPIRKWVWAIGAVAQGACMIGIALAALLLEGAAAGWAILALLAALSLARSAGSIAHKDVLGKTVRKATRGTVAGTAGTASAVAVLVFGVLLGAGIVERSIATIAAALVVGGALWIAAALLFASLAESPGATEGGGNALAVALRQFGLLRDDPQLVRFIAVRCLLMATALAPPFVVALGERESAHAGTGTLGPFVIAAALASISSSYVWGRLSDVSSRRVLVVASAMGAVCLLLAAAIGAGFGEPFGVDADSMLALPALVFVATIADQGVKLGRTTHVVDMSGTGDRGAYTALTNTIGGVAMLGAGVFGLIDQRFGAVTVLALLALMCVVAMRLAAGLEEVQRVGSAVADAGTGPA